MLAGGGGTGSSAPCGGAGATGVTGSKPSSASTGLSRNVLPSEFYSSHVPATERESKKKLFLSLSEQPTGSAAGASATSSEVLTAAVATRLLGATASSKGKESAPPGAAIVPSNPFPKSRPAKAGRKRGKKKKKPKKVRV